MFTETLTQDPTETQEGPAVSPTQDSSPEAGQPEQESGGDVETTPNDLKGDLHKDARFRRVIEQRNRLREQLREATAPKQPEQRQEQQQSQGQSRPAWFAKYFGDDDEAWEGFRQMTASARDEAKREALAEIRREADEKAADAKKWNDWVAEQKTDLMDEGEVADEQEWNRLCKVMDQFGPTTDGRLDFRKGLAIMRQQFQPKGMGDRRKLADSMNTRPKGDAPRPKVVTSADLRRMERNGEI